MLAPDLIQSDWQSFAKRKIIHIDMDAFFASIEQKDHPIYKGKPLVVGGMPQSRGVVAACSYEARKFGIHSAMPCAKAARLCPQAIFTPPRMARYKEISIKIMEIFKQYTDLVEPLSVDEAFLDVTTNSLSNPSATHLAKHICHHIYQEVDLTASAGISFNKFLAKVASDINKPNGITTIPPEQAERFLSLLPIRKFYGIGLATENKMKNLGINNGGDLKKWDEQSLVFHFGKIGTFFYNIVRGRDDRLVEPFRIRKSIGNEITLSTDILDLQEIQTILASLAEKVAALLHYKQKGGATITLKVRYDNFDTITRSLTPKFILYSVSDILLTLPGLLSATEAGRRKIRLLGIAISNLRDLNKQPRQLKLPFIE